MIMNHYQKMRYDSALRYCDRGWRVLPATIGKALKPLLHDWVNEASNDKAVVHEMFRGYENCNIALATGKESGFFVIDVDIKNGKNGLKSLVDEYGDGFINGIDKLTQLMAKTPTGGKHLLYRMEGMEVSNHTNVLSGIDIRGDGGCIFAAPSTRLLDDEWKNYAWNNESLEIPPAPEWCLKLLQDAKDGRHCSADGSTRTGKGFTDDDLNDVVSGLTAGERDEQINRFIWFCIGKGLDRGVVEPFAKTAADYCKPPMEHDVVVEQVKRAYAQKDNGKGKTNLSMVQVLKELKEKTKT